MQWEEEIVSPMSGGGRAGSPGQGGSGDSPERLKKRLTPLKLAAAAGQQRQPCVGPCAGRQPRQAKAAANKAIAVTFGPSPPLYRLKPLTGAEAAAARDRQGGQALDFGAQARGRGRPSKGSRRSRAGVDEEEDEFESSGAGSSEEEDEVMSLGSSSEGEEDASSSEESEEEEEAQQRQQPLKQADRKPGKGSQGAAAKAAAGAGPGQGAKKLKTEGAGSKAAGEEKKRKEGKEEKKREAEKAGSVAKAKGPDKKGKGGAKAGPKASKQDKQAGGAGPSSAKPGPSGAGSKAAGAGVGKGKAGAGAAREAAAKQKEKEKQPAAPMTEEERRAKMIEGIKAKAARGMYGEGRLEGGFGQGRVEGQHMCLGMSVKEKLEFGTISYGEGGNKTYDVRDLARRLEQVTRPTLPAITQVGVLGAFSCHHGFSTCACLSWCVHMSVHALCACVCCIRSWWDDTGGGLCQPGPVAHAAADMVLVPCFRPAVSCRGLVASWWMRAPASSGAGSLGEG